MAKPKSSTTKKKEAPNVNPDDPTNKEHDPEAKTPETGAPDDPERVFGPGAIPLEQR